MYALMPSTSIDLTKLDLIRMIYERIVNHKTFAEIRRLGFKMSDSDLISLLLEIDWERN